MSKQFIMGNEAIGLGAIKAGVKLVSGYPGTPSTEVLKRWQKIIRETSMWNGRPMKRQVWKWQPEALIPSQKHGYEEPGWG